MLFCLTHTFVSNSYYHKLIFLNLSSNYVFERVDGYHITLFPIPSNSPIYSNEFLSLGIAAAGDNEIFVRRSKKRQQNTKPRMFPTAVEKKKFTSAGRLGLVSPLQ
jgi:hypothetical protein